VKKAQVNQSFWHPTYYCRECGMSNFGKKIPCSSAKEAVKILDLALGGNYPDVSVTRSHKCSSGKRGLLLLEKIREFQL